MNTIVINGSPKAEQSNTFKLTQAFLSGAGAVGYDVVESAKLDIKPCAGCFGCFKNTRGLCRIKDDMAGVLEKIKAADLVVWSFPLYYFSVPGGLKNLIDRQLPLSLPFMTGRTADTGYSGGHPPRFDLSHQRQVVVSTCGFYTTEGNFTAVDAMFTHYYREYVKIYCGQGELFSVPQLSARTEEYLSYVKQAGAEYSRGKIMYETRQKLNEPLYPEDAYESMANASWGMSKSAEGETVKADESLTFTRQMAALYNKANYDKDRIIEMNYTDIGKRYQIALTADGASVAAENLITADTVINTPFALWQSIAKGDIAGSDALAQGKYNVTGDFSAMLKWDTLFGAVTSEKPHESREFSKRAKLFNSVNIAGASAGAAFLICGGDYIYLVVTQVFFALFWGASVFMKVPVTCYFSAAGYGGEKMLSNLLFTRTNRILTACWAAEYLLMAATLVLLHFWNAPELFFALTYLPAPILGVFTAWFAKWYPARMARGKHAQVPRKQVCAK
ncbi:hypothetical protein FACS1894120_2800 [Clostridia bacterium]|nr:hypothetical protein FACS1894120_2800 [Clostridia bacterium]